jgi:hypothetical protein
MIRAILAFLAVWGVVFFGLSYIWHTSKAEKFDMIRGLFYSFMTAFVTLAVMTAIVVMF